MKTDTQIKFDTIIKEGFTPLLKPLSFKKKALNYYRQLSEVGHIINIQKDRYSHRNHIKFRIKIGIFEPKVYEEEKTYGTRYITILMNKNSSKKFKKIYNNTFFLSLTSLIR